MFNYLFSELKWRLDNRGLDNRGMDNRGTTVLYLIATLKYALPFTTFTLKFLNLRNSCLVMVMMRFFLIAAPVFFSAVCFVPPQKILILLRKISFILSYLLQNRMLYRSEHRSLNYACLLSHKFLCVSFFNLQDGCLDSSF